MLKKLLLPFLFLCCFSTTYAGTSFSTAAWIPYWKKNDGASTTLANITSFTEISPFSYEVTDTGSLKDASHIREEPWTSLIADAKKRGIKVYPSILWIDRDAMEKILNNKKERKLHIEEIVSEVLYYKFDGIDIDYEGKSAETREGFSAFLKELSTSLKKNKKQLICTIEARTPIDSRYLKVTKELLARIEYSNDFKAIGKYCDKVRFMTYDQIDGDVKLSTFYKSELYRPVADIAWVKKVLTLALKDIPAHKIVVGVATYGYKYEYTQTATGITYKKIGSMNYKYAEELAKSLSITPTRNKAGELQFTYASTTDISNKNPGVMKNYFVTYSDSVAIAEKIRIAKLYNLGGVAVFKIDGAQDPNVFNVIKKK
jgi:spore germination protein YaaH